MHIVLHQSDIICSSFVYKLNRANQGLQSARNCRFGSIKTKLYDERDEYNRQNLNFFFIATFLQLLHMEHRSL